MKQKVCEFYCEKRKKNIGDGLTCFVCTDIVRSTKPEQMCVYERTIREYEREV